jgi:hypothetical protein
MMEFDQGYREQVARLIADELIGILDDDPLVIVDDVVDTTGSAPAGVVLRLEIHTGTVHSFGRSRVYTFYEWDDYADKRPASMAAGLAVQIGSELVEQAATGGL